VEQPEDLSDLSGESIVQPDGPGAKSSDSAPQHDQLTRQTQWSNWTVLAMIVLCFFVIVRFRPFTARDAGQGKTLAELRLQPLSFEGQPVELPELTGRVVLISFWETGSSASRQALPHLAAVEKQFRGQPAFKLYSVACGRRTMEDYPTLRRDARQVMQQERLDLPIYADPGGISRSAVQQAVGLSGYPVTLLLDRVGRIRKAWTGLQPGAEAEMQQLIAQLLEE
jgi:thiol-disulfide isomerase/thioredoxin